MKGEKIMKHSLIVFLAATLICMVGCSKPEASTDTSKKVNDQEAKMAENLVVALIEAKMLEKEGVTPTEPKMAENQGVTLTETRMAKPEYQRHLDWSWINRHDMIVTATKLALAGDSGPALEHCYASQSDNPGAVSCLKANWQAVVAYLISEFGPYFPPIREYEMHVDWSWANRRELVTEAVHCLRAGRREAALNRLYESQRGKSGAVSCLKANWEAVLAYLRRKYDPQVPASERWKASCIMKIIYENGSTGVSSLRYDGYGFSKKDACANAELEASKLQDISYASAVDCEYEKLP